MRNNKNFQEFMLQHQDAIVKGLSKLDSDQGHREYFQNLIIGYLEETNDYRSINKHQFEILFGSESLIKGIPQIVQQKKKVVQTLSPYKSARSLKVSKVGDESISNYLSV